MPVEYTKDLLAAEMAQFGYKIGDFSYGRPNVINFGEGKILSIGKYCSISGGVNIFLGGNHRADWVTTYPFSAIADTWPEASNILGHPQSNGNVCIGSDVWIGANSTILSGITIGNGSVIAASSVVTKDVPPYAIIGGNPARILKYRFEKYIIDDLLKINWWDWPSDKVRSMIPHLLSNDIEYFVTQAYLSKSITPSQ